MLVAEANMIIVPRLQNNQKLAALWYVNATRPGRLERTNCLMRARIRITIGDGILLAFIVVMAGLLFFLLPGWVVSGGTHLEIRSGDKIVGRYPLDQVQRIRVPGLLGVTEVLVEGRRARIESSPCPHKKCCSMSAVGEKGGVIVCAPNEVIISVGRERQDHLDAVTR